jgi:hypothetical protein
LYRYIAAWFVLGKMGGFNSENMQVQSNFFEVSNMEYDMDMANSSDGDVPTVGVVQTS